MKKNLLSFFILIVSVNTFCQNNLAKPTGSQSMSELLAKKYAPRNISENTNPITSQNNSLLQKEMNAVAAPTVQWKAIGSSSNIHGMLVSQSKPLNYNDNLNTVTFVHLKGSTYTAQPFSNSGAVVARVSQNWGTTWDSTCIWSNNTDFATSAQGVVYNPAGGSNINNSYFVGAGPVITGTNITGNFYASKQLGLANYGSLASQTLNAQQFVANTPSFAPNLTKHDYSRYSMSSTDDGMVRSLAGRYFDYSSGEPKDFRGAAVIKGNFNAGTFTWTSDTIMPNVIVKTNGARQLYDKPIMAWNESGTHGYAIFIGAVATATGSNRGWQPIVYKSSNSGISWVQINGIDFNDVNFSSIKSKINPVYTNTNLTIPFFNVNEGFDATVDIDNRLHLVSTIVGTKSSHNDSLDYVYQFGTQKYCWPHVPGQRPYIYDFYGDGLGWNYMLIDSMSSEAPGSFSTSPGYTSNPWDVDPSNNNMKVTSDARIQLSRTPLNGYIICTWTESDTAFTNQAEKWNTLPNIKVRALSSYLSLILSPTEINVTKPTPAPIIPTYTTNPNVSSRAMFHHTSPTSLFISCSNNIAHFRVPISVSTSSPCSQLTENRHWVSCSTLDFSGTWCPGSVKENSPQNLSINIFPNPAHLSATIFIEEKTTEKINVRVLNVIGQTLKNQNIFAEENKINLDLSLLPVGIYFVQVKCGENICVRKLIVE